MSAEPTAATARPRGVPDGSGALERLRDDPRAAAVAALFVIVAALVIVLAAGRDTWFYLDEWDFAVRATNLSADSVLTPQNQNWHSTTVFVYRGLLDLFGFSSYVPFRLVSAGLLAGLGVLGYLYARLRIGPWWALLPLALLIISPGFEILLWPFQMGQLISAVAGLGALVLFDGALTRGRGIVIAVLLIVAVASSSAGIPLVALVVYDRLLMPGRRVEALLALPAILAYGLWYLEYGTREDAPNDLTAGALTARLGGRWTSATA